MGRDEVINRLIADFSAPAYLEIGVQNGYTFHAIKAQTKVAVDPKFEFDVPQAKLDPANDHCLYHEVPSDTFFSSIVGARSKFDLIFIDGLHTFDQTLRDLMSASVVLSEGGVIVIDDVMPVTYASSISDIVQFSRFREAAGIAEGSWMGDVFKLVFFVRHYMPLFSFATIQENHGQTVLWRDARLLDDVTPKIDAITRLDYSDFLLSTSSFNIRPFEEILALTRQSRCSPRAG